MLPLKGMVKKLFLVSLILLVSYTGSGCVSFEKFAHKRQYDKAEKVIEKAIEYNPGNVKAWIALGDVYLTTEEYREARYAYEEALRLYMETLLANSGPRATWHDKSRYAEEVKEKVRNKVEAFKDAGDKTPERFMAIFNALNFLHEYEKAAVIAED